MCHTIKDWILGYFSIIMAFKLLAELGGVRISFSLSASKQSTYRVDLESKHNINITSLCLLD